jgi:hypothetical protein
MNMTTGGIRAGGGTTGKSIMIGGGMMIVIEGDTTSTMIEGSTMRGGGMNGGQTSTMRIGRRSESESESTSARIGERAMMGDLVESRQNRQEVKAHGPC